MNQTTTDNTDNVHFLRPSLSNNIQFTPSELREQINDSKFEICKEVTDVSFDNFLGLARSFGFFNNPARIHDKDLMFLEETIMSVLSRSYGIEHPMHELIDSMFADDEEGDELIEEETEQALEPQI